MLSSSGQGDKRMGLFKDPDLLRTCLVRFRFYEVCLPSLTPVFRLCMAASFTIYVLAGRDIFRKRRQLRSFNSNSKGHHNMLVTSTLDRRYSSYKTTEIQVTSELADLSTRPSRESVNGGDRTGPKAYDQYSVTIGGGTHLRVSSPRSPAFPSSSKSLIHPSSPKSNPLPTTSGLPPQANRPKNAAMEANTASWAYTKCCILFFMSLLVTWVCKLHLPIPRKLYDLNTILLYLSTEVC